MASANIFFCVSSEKQSFLWKEQLNDVNVNELGAYISTLNISNTPKFIRPNWPKSLDILLRKGFVGSP